MEYFTIVILIGETIKAQLWAKLEVRQSFPLLVYTSLFFLPSKIFGSVVQQAIK